MAGEWRFNPSVHRAKGDRLVGARVLPVCHNDCLVFAVKQNTSSELVPVVIFSCFSTRTLDQKYPISRQILRDIWRQ